MSLLSPLELASRGAMFLGVGSIGGGGKGGGKGNGSVPALKIEGLLQTLQIILVLKICEIYSIQNFVL